MSVAKIFKTLIVVIVCVVIGAFVLNTLLPNVVANLCNTIENGIKNATGISFDLNGDGVGQSSANAESDDVVDNGVGVAGYGDLGTGGGGGGGGTP